MKLFKLKNIHRRKNFMQMALVGIFYLLAFFALEQRQVPIHIVHCALDNVIPFCEYFIIPYILWFFYVLLTGCYFAFVNEDNEEFKPFCYTIITGMIVFLLISYIYPNGQLLRPDIEGDTFFKQLVLLLYQADTSTNILPSLHVFYSIACEVAFEKHEKARKNKAFITMIRILTISIVLSTMFLKQHSAIDVFMALAMNGICYHLFYHMGEFREWQKVRVTLRRRKKKLEGF